MEEAAVERDSSSPPYHLPTTKVYLSYNDDDEEVRGFREWMRWGCVDQSTAWRAILSWSVFFLLAVGVPIASHFAVVCCGENCEVEDQRQPYDAIVELSLSSISAVSYLSLIRFSRRYGLRKFLFLDKMCDESEKVRLGYTDQLQRSMRILCVFVLPCSALYAAYKIWWYATGGVNIRHWGNVYLSHTFACALELCSWVYRTSIFFLACSLYRVICYLQILRLDDFALHAFHHQQHANDVSAVLADHLRIRRTLKVISHRFRLYICSTLLLVTVSQLASLLVTTKSDSHVNIYTAGELALCSVTLVTGLCICLRTSAKITHKAQSITSLAAKWHVCSTIEYSFDDNDCTDDTDATSTSTAAPIVNGNGNRAVIFPLPQPPNYNCTHSDEDELGQVEDDDDNDLIDNTNIMMVPAFANTISYQKRQALVTYLENNKAGITVYGFMLDRTSLHTIFGVELSLVLWLLSKTVGIS